MNKPYCAGFVCLCFAAGMFIAAYIVGKNDGRHDYEQELFKSRRFGHPEIFHRAFESLKLKENTKGKIILRDGVVRYYYSLAKQEELKQ